MWKELQHYTQLHVEPEHFLYQEFLNVLRQNYGKLVFTDDLRNLFLLSEGSLVAFISKLRHKLENSDSTIYSILGHNAYIYHRRQPDGNIKLLQYYPEVRAALHPDARELMDYSLTTARTNLRGKDTVLNLPFRDMELEIIGTLAQRFGETVADNDLILACYGDERLKLALAEPLEHEYDMTSIRCTVSRARDVLDTVSGGKYVIRSGYSEGYVLSLQNQPAEM